MLNTFTETLFAQIASRPDELVYRFLDSAEVEGVVREMTYAELGIRARAIGAALQDSRPRRALLLYPAGQEFAEAFFGCLAAGVAAVPAPLPEWDNRSLRRLRRMVTHAEVEVVLAPARVAADSAALCAEIPELAGLRWLATDEIPGEHANDWREPELGPDSIAFIQYTSGSTSAPRGVLITHENLLHNQGAIADGLGHPRDFAQSWDGALFASWLPMYHDMGLIAPLLHTVYLGANSVLMSPMHFLQRPERWLRAISDYRAHTSGGPNFAYELCVRRIAADQIDDLDLSTWRVAFNGSEPVRAATIRRFADTFARAGFRAGTQHPVYGLAEATLIVTGPSIGVPPTFHEVKDALGDRARGAELVGVGRAVGGMSLAIVDPETGTERSDGTEGEIWVAGKSVAAGYFRDDQATADVFGARLPGDERRYLRTGDLGFVSGGELFVTGRSKDLLIIDGRNHYPQDIESTVEAAHSGVRAGCVAAFSVELGSGGEQPVVVAEVRTEEPDELASIEAAVRGAVSTEHGLTLATLMLIRPGTIFKTSSGKIQRQACRAAYGSGELLELTAGPLRSPEDELFDFEESEVAAIAEATTGPSTEAVRAWLVKTIAQQAALDPERIDIHQPIVEFGLGSADLVELVIDLSDFYGEFLDTNLFFDNPTIDGVARALSPVAETVPETVAPEVTATAETTDADGEGIDEDAIAIISMSCRFPGAADSPEALWRLLDGNGDALGEVPEGRWDIEDLYDPDTTASGKAYTFRGGYVEGLDRFDAAFFGIGPREAAVMDPQQRMMLQLAWEAIERSGRDPRTLHGSATGVYLGVYATGYLADPAPEQLNGQVGTGLSPSVASGRISYTLGLHGPAVTLDTACSSSIVAMHSAMAALRAGECDLALAGGTTLLMSPIAHIELCKLGVLSPTGKCAPFSAEADGTVWAEGAGLVLLKRLDDARRDGDRVLAVIRGSAVNQDGRSQGLSAPNGAAQEQVLRSALRVSGLSPHDIDYVEAHGTGTALGDPIEARALARVFGPGRDPERPLGIGSLKSNVGHTQAAAGVASVIKLVLALQHERIPATLNAKTSSPHVDWERSGVAVAGEELPWRRGERVRRAGVSAFGLSGTNAHLILEEAPAVPVPAAEAATADQRVALLPISARSEASLHGQAQRLLDLVSADPTLEPAPVARSLALRRTRFERRSVVVAADREQMIDALRALVDGSESPDAVTGNGAVLTNAKTAFIFPGQGTQWVGMARDMLLASEEFRTEFERCDKAFSALLGWSPQERLATMTVEDLWDHPLIQPLLFMIMAGLAATWRAAGVTPDAVIGHSQGEVAAAYCAGVLELGDAARIVVTRSRLIQDIEEPGAMAVVGLPEAEVIPRLAKFSDRVSIAAVNVRRSTFVTGQQAAVEEFLAELTEAGIYNKLRAAGPSLGGHSPMYEPLREPLAAALAGMTAEAPVTQWYSTVTGEPITESVEPGYWFRNARQTVRFADTVERMIGDGFRYFVELGAHPMLTAAVKSLSDELSREVIAVGSLLRDQDGPTALARAQAELHVAGHELDWTSLLPDAARVDLPTYAFDERSFWTERLNRDSTALGLGDIEHPILGAVVPQPDSGGIILTGRVSRRLQPWVTDHAGPNAVLMPGAALIELAIRAGDEVDSPVVRELLLRAPLLVPERGALRVQAVVGGLDAQDCRTVRIYARDEQDPDAQWTLHADGLLAKESALAPAHSDSPLRTSGYADAWVAPDPATPGQAHSDTATWPPQGAERIDVAELYTALHARGHQYGPYFQGMRAAWRRADEIFAEIELPESAHGDATRFGIHPALLDAALHATALYADDGTHALLPFAWTDVTLWASGATALRVRLTRSGAETVSMSATDRTGNPVVSVGSLLLRPVAATQWDAASLAPAYRRLFRLNWTERTLGTGNRALTVAEWHSPDLTTAGSESTSAASGSGTVATSTATNGVHAPAQDTARPTWRSASAENADAVILLVPKGNSPEQVHTVTQDLLATLQTIIGDPRFERATLVVRTRGAVAPITRGDNASPDPAGAVAWGLVRSAQSENPGRIVLIDSEDSELDIAALLATEEPQLAVRGGVAFVPRLARLPENATRMLEGRVGLGEGAVLVTGAPGGLGSALARHLAEAYGVRDLVLVSRRGIDGPGGHQLRADLENRGVRVRFAQCDITDRNALAVLLDGLPLAGVVHAATVLDDSTLGSLTPAQLDTVLRPKVDAAHHLHELTADRDLSIFVLFSAAGGLFGTPGQANYAAANAYLDALALYRRSIGLPAQSLAWGAWEVNQTEYMARADLQRFERAGVRAFSTADGMACFDAALRSGDPMLVPLLLDTEVLRREPGVPRLLHGLVRRTVRRAVADRSAEDVVAESLFAERLRTVPRAEAVTLAIAAISEWTGQVLGHAGTAQVSAEANFQSLGLDSLMAIELRNKVREHTGVSVPLGTILAEQNLTDLAGFLVDELLRQSDSTADAVAADVPDIEVLPVSRDMMRLLRTEQLGIPSAAQTGGVAVRIPIPITRAQLEQAITRLAHRHAALRTTIRRSEEHGRQLEIHREPGALTSWLDLDHLDDAVVRERFRELMARPFDLETGPLWRFELLNSESDSPVLLFGAHHSMSDVQSMLLVAGEIAAELSGEPLIDTVTNRDMHQLLTAQPGKREGDEIAAARWRELFAGARRLELTLAQPRPAQRSYGAGSLALDMPAGLHDRVADRARDLGVTPAAIFLGSLSVLLARRQGADRFALAVPVDTRMHADATDAVGYFGLPVPFPAAVDAGDSVSDVLERTGERLRSLLAPGAGFADVLAALAAEGLHRDNAPMIEVYFNYLRANSAVAAAEVVPVSTGYSDLDLMVAVLPDTGQVWFTYNSDIIDADSCTDFGTEYLATVAAAIADPGAPARPELADAQGVSGVRAAVGATFALGRLPELLTAASADSSAITVAEAPYHHVLSSLRDPSGVFAQTSMALSIVLLRAADLERFGGLSDELLTELATEYPAAIKELAERNRKPVIVGMLPSAVAEERLLTWERLVTENLREVPGVAALEPGDWTRNHQVDNPFDDRTEILAHLPFTPEFQAAVALTLVATVGAVIEPAPKVIAVDGDDTLWSGTAGEIGSAAVGFDVPRLALARRLAQWRAAGTLLVLVTNNDADIVDAILDRPESPLRREDFADISTGWEAKPERLEQVAHTLGLSLDTFCYLDDNPVEVARMRTELPEVLSVTCPPAAELESFLTRLWPMTPIAATAEDRMRADFYRQDGERDRARATAEFADFLEQLELEVDIEPLTDATLERAQQLVRRTTQFTLATVTPADLDRWRAEGEVWTATARDRFGDYGLISLLAVRTDGDALVITGWQLSCRALGRGVEERLLTWAADRAEALGHNTIRISFERTARNEPARRLAARLLGVPDDGQGYDVSVTPDRLRHFRSWDAHPNTEELTSDRT
ncbi:HAD-IIIC family phosphatase [Nocardia sp. NPDC056100]|uniref:HAD-IIIC family phosphatase n=1 Tax=Nocardia sp. NPDC056100 TaxID=3345712 RepID=UPI0035D8F4DC